MLLASTSVAGAQDTHTVAVGDFFFCDDETPSGECTTTIAAGDTVVWDYAEGTAGHTVTDCGESCDIPTDSPVFDSGRMLAGDTFSVTFDEPGTFLYYCEFHPVAMRANLVVEAQETEEPTAAPTETAAPTPEPTDEPTPAPTDEPTPSPSPDGTATPAASPSPAPDDDDDDDGDSIVWLIVGIVIASVVVIAAGALYTYSRRGR